MAKAKELKVSRAIELSRAISMPGSLMNTTGGALDVRYAASNEADRISIPQASRYEGLQVFQQDTKTLYILKDNSTANGTWEAVALGGSVASDLANVIQKLTAVEQTVSTQGEQIATNASGINTLKGRVDGIDTEIAGIKSAATELGEKVANNEGEIATVKGRVAAAEGKITTAEGKIKAVEGRLDVVEPKVTAVVEESAKNKTDIAALTEVVANNKSAADTAIAAVDAKVDANKQEANGRLTAIEEKAATNATNIAALDSKVDTKVGELVAKDAAQDAEIQKIKETITNKNNNTVVVNEFDEIAIANPTPKSGDLAYVISEKKSYIYTENAPTAVVSKSGEATGQWIVFDEISSELDLVNYLKSADAEATYRKLADKIAKGDLATELATEIDAKATTEAMNAALALKADKEAVTTALAGKADKAHTHAIADVTGLQASLDGKAASVHSHVVANITDFATEVEKAIVAKDYATNTAVTALEGKVNTHIADGDKHVSAVQKQQLADLGVKGTEGSLFNKVEALEAKKVEVDNKTIVRGENDVISVKDGVFAAATHSHTVSEITDLDAHLDSKGYASQGTLDNHTSNNDIHVTKEQKDNWEAHRTNLGIHVQVGGEAPAPNTFGLWLDFNADRVEPVVGTFRADETACD